MKEALSTRPQRLKQCPVCKHTPKVPPQDWEPHLNQHQAESLMRRGEIYWINSAMEAVYLGRHYKP